MCRAGAADEEDAQPAVPLAQRPEPSATPHPKPGKGKGNTGKGKASTGKGKGKASTGKGKSKASTGKGKGKASTGKGKAAEEDAGPSTHASQDEEEEAESAVSDDEVQPVKRRVGADKRKSKVGASWQHLYSDSDADLFMVFVTGRHFIKCCQFAQLTFETFRTVCWWAWLAIICPAVL